MLLLDLQCFTLRFYLQILLHRDTLALRHDVFLTQAVFHARTHTHTADCRLNDLEEEKDDVDFALQFPESERPDNSNPKLTSGSYLHESRYVDSAWILRPESLSRTMDRRLCWHLTYPCSRCPVLDNTKYPIILHVISLLHTHTHAHARGITRML